MPREKFQRVHAPIGLSIGAITPEEIAVAVVAELIAERRQAQSSVPHMRYSDQLAEAAPEAEPAERD